MGIGLFVMVATLWSVSADQLDTYLDKLAQVDASNCHEKDREDLVLPINLLGNLPEDTEDAFPVPSLIREAKILALNRALFFTITNQRLNASMKFRLQPDMYYTYLSTAASLMASLDGIVGAGIYYDQNTFYPNFYYSVYFNQTLDLFAPHAQHDLGTIKVKDDSLRNYTNNSFKTGEWYKLWLPDVNSWKTFEKSAISTVDPQGDYEGGYFAIADSNPVRFTTAYYDCGRTNKWVVTASSPVVDFLARYTAYKYLQRPRFAAVSTVDIDFTAMDINQCDLSFENLPPNVFASTHKCKPTTQCRPLRGFGFSRGGYECVCQHGFVYPDDGPKGPYSGQTIEAASAEEYADGFHCVESQDGSTDGDSSQNSFKFFLDENLLRQMNSVNGSDCGSNERAIELPAIGPLDGYFTEQARTALRLAQHLSGMLQQPSESPGENFLIMSPQSLNTVELLAEVEAIVLSDDQIATAQAVVMLDNDELTSAFAKRSPYEDGLIVDVDSWTQAMYDANIAHMSVDDIAVVDKAFSPWVKPLPSATQLEQMPTWTFKAPSLADARWGDAEFSCQVNAWVVNVAFPVLGFDNEDNVIVRGESSLYIRLPKPTLREAA